MGTFVRFATAGILVVAFAATATAVAGLLQVRQITHYLDATPSFKASPSVVVPNPGSAQTILLVGSDHRAGTPFKDVNTDTMMLVRINPKSKTINLLSVPRDLQVQIPEGGTVASAKLNAAYFYGGPGLLIKILQQQVFPGLKVNHVVDVGFGGFEKMINAIGCVYTDVDHRYYNNTAVTDYSSIDLQPGYQKLCGADALSFVRFRHTDSDIVRNARQQDFIRWAKSQFSQDQVINERDTLLKIFGKNATTDHNLHTTDGLINMFDLVAFSAASTIKQIPFPAIILPCSSGNTGTTVVQGPACYVSAEHSQEQSAFHAFMTPTSTPAAPSSGVEHHASACGRRRQGFARGWRASSRPHRGRHRRSGPGEGARADRDPDLLPEAARVGLSVLLELDERVPAGDSEPGLLPPRLSAPRPAGRRPLLLPDDAEINPILGEYYGVQGTTWQNPPILTKPSETKFVNGKQLLLYANGGKISLVAWRTAKGVYWVSNTLTDNIPNRQLVAIAASFTRGGGK